MITDKRDYIMEMINIKKKRKKVIKKWTAESYQNSKICYICEFFFKINMLTINNFVKLEIIVITQGNVEVKHITHVT